MFGHVSRTLCKGTRLACCGRSRSALAATTASTLQGCVAARVRFTEVTCARKGRSTVRNRNGSTLRPKALVCEQNCCTAVATATPHCAASEGEIVGADKQKPRWKCKPVRSEVVRLCPQRQRKNTQSPKSVPHFAASLGFQR